MNKKTLIKSRDKKISKPSDVKKKTIYFPTGSTTLDKVMCGIPNKSGLRGGKIHRFSGDRSAGKSFIASEIIAASKRLYKDHLVFNYDDSESGNTMDIDEEGEEKKLALYNFKLITDTSAKSETVQELYINVYKFFTAVDDDDYGIYVVDSLDGIGSIESEERAEEILKQGPDYKEGSYSVEKQKFLKQTFFRVISSLLNKKPNCLLIMVGQLTTNLAGGTFTRKLLATGGKGLDFFSHSHLFIANIEKLERVIEKQKRTYGVRLKCKTDKLKAARPHREVFITILYSYGFDNIMDNLDFYFGTLTPEGKRQSIEIKEVKGVKKSKWMWEGIAYKRDELLAKIEEDELEDKLIELVNEKWERIENLAIPKRKKRV